MLYDLIAEPIEILFEILFVNAYRLTNNTVLSIVMLSLAVNILSLPLYKKAELIQRKARETEKKLKYWTTHIKRNFKGDERYMMLRTYYRQNDYNPLDVIGGLMPLLLQIPFFAAAYHFLSNLPILEGTTLGAIKSLSEPDGLIVISGITINLLPLLMTLINIVSSTVYSKNLDRKTRFQLFITAGVFLVLLYNSPSGLVFYWTLNNLFSLVKNIIFLILPLKDKQTSSVRVVSPKEDTVFLFSSIVETVFTGLYIPAGLIAFSTAEFLEEYTVSNLSQLLVRPFLISAGFFLIWGGIIYRLSSLKLREFLSAAMFSVCCISVADFMFFGTMLGNLSPMLIFDKSPEYDTTTIVHNLIMILAIILIVRLLMFYKNHLLFIIPVLSTVVVLSFTGIAQINKENRSDIEVLTRNAQYKSPASFTFSRSSKNVVIIMLDRAVGYLVPYMFEEKPELYDMYSGFTYYPNTVSYGTHTNIGTPGLYGGYEYIPSEMNRKSDKLLKDKQNEAICVLPVLMDNAGFDVHVCDMPYGNYEWSTDLTVYDAYPNIHKHITKGQYNADNENLYSKSVETIGRDFFMYAIFKTAPVVLQEWLYADGTYYTPVSVFNTDGASVNNRVGEGLDHTIRVSKSFRNSFNVLKALSSITRVEDNTDGTFVILENNSPHEPCILQEPGYEEDVIDNTEYDKEHALRYAPDGTFLDMKSPKLMSHYHVNMASLLKVGEWLEYLKSQGVYDNTRIIIVSDHGYNIGGRNDMIFDYTDYSGKNVTYDLGFLNCLLMVKDFNSRSFETNEDFMTNADVPSIVLDGIIDGPVNPFTGLPIDNHVKFEKPVELFETDEFVPDKSKYRFDPAEWFSVNGNIKDLNNWKYLGHY